MGLLADLCARRGWYLGGGIFWILRGFGVVGGCWFLRCGLLICLRISLLIARLVGFAVLAVVFDGVGGGFSSF